MYIRRECLAATGLFREDVFAQGYGEENDFCLRARAAGLAARGGAGRVRRACRRRTRSAARARSCWRATSAVLERLHPGYRALIAAHRRADPLARRPAPARRGALPRARRLRGRAAVLLVTHDSGGGVERAVRRPLRRRCAPSGRRPIVLRPGARRPRARAVTCPASAWSATAPRAAYPEPAIRAARRVAGAACACCAPDRPEAMEVHHLLGPPRPCGAAAAGAARHSAMTCMCTTTPDLPAHHPGRPDAPLLRRAGGRGGLRAPASPTAGGNTGEDIAVAALRARSAAELAGARRVVVPSADAAARLRRHFPGLTVGTRPARGRCRLAAAPDLLRSAVPGAAPGLRDRRHRRARRATTCCWPAPATPPRAALTLEFIVVGHTPDDAAAVGHRPGVRHRPVSRKPRRWR